MKTRLKKHIRDWASVIDILGTFPGKQKAEVVNKVTSVLKYKRERKSRILRAIKPWLCKQQRALTRVI